MLDPKYLYYVTDNAVEIADKMENAVLYAIISRIMLRLKRGEKYILTAADKYRIETLQESGMLLEEITKIISKHTGLMEKEIVNAMLDAEVESLAWDEKVYARAGLTKYKSVDEIVKAVKDKLNISDAEAKRRARRIIRQSPYVARVNERNFKATMGTWHNMTKTVAFNSVKKYVDIVDDAYNKTMSGAMSYTQAVKENVDKLASEGVKLTNRAGREESIEAATLRNVRTGVGQTTANLTLERMKEMEIDHVMVSSHLGARYGDGKENPGNHYWWQGKVYQYVELIEDQERSEYPDFIKSTGYGTGEGLCGWNCRHSFSPFIEGMHNPYEHYDEKENKKRYDLEQKCRAMERNIRKWKKKAECLKAYLEAEEDTEVRAELRYVQDNIAKLTKSYIAFCKEHNLRPLTERLEIAKAERAKNYV